MADWSKNDRGNASPTDLVTTHCSLRATNGTGEMRSYKMGPSMRKAGLVLMAVLGSSPTGLADRVRDPLRCLPLDAAR